MSVCRKLPDGTVQKIAGHTILLDANASEVRQGRWNLVSTTTEWVVQNIIFTDPMPDNDYIVIIESDAQSWAMQPGPYRITNKTTTGFTLASFNGTNARGQVDMNMAGVYTAFKPVKIEGYTELQNKVNNPDDTPTIDSMNLVTSDGVARAIENASAVWKGTKAEWNALPSTDKVKYDLAVLLDQTLVKAIDRTDGTETNVADLSGQFVGTHAEWEAESNKTQYKTAVLTDERTTVNEVLSTGALNEVADNAKIWRGTKAEWDAMSTAEKAEWDQAEIETIEAQGLNPFRTLSDPEPLFSIASGTDYTCPHDGFIVVKGARSSNFTVTINGVTFFDTYTISNDENGILVPVQQGDVIRIVAEAAPQVYARWYTTDINPGNPIDYPVIRRSQSLDWDNKVAISNTELQSGWTAPSDGYFICCNLPNFDSGDTFITLNDTKVGHGIHNSNFVGAYNVQIPVINGDVLKSSTSLYVWTDTTWFVPYKDYPDYSTTEHWTGRRWIDGKKIYSKTVAFDINASESNIPVPHGITGIGTFRTVDVPGSCCIRKNGNSYIVLGHGQTGATGNNFNVSVSFITDSDIQMQAGGSTGGARGYVTILYTKATD